MRPRIGITTSTLAHDPKDPSQLSSVGHVTYANCIYQAGGLPLLLPNLPATAVEDVLDDLDGLLLSGGGDFDSILWDEPLHPTVISTDPIRDNFEIALVRSALHRDLPVFGICRGVQALAVATGGELWQDIPSQCPHNVGHYQSTSRQLPSHSVAVHRDTLLADILWPEMPENDNELTIRVNSFHHQAPRDCGRLFTVAASSTDGIIEALVAPDARFALGVQWHPEEMAFVDPLQARLFTALITAAQG